MSDTITPTSIPVVLTAAGRVNTQPAVLRDQLIAYATGLSPGLTVLPAGLIDDISGTDTGALVVMDEAVTEVLDSISPYGANQYMLVELGQIYLGQGSTALPASNTAVYVVFSGSVGFVIPPGFLVSDGTYQYAVIDGTAVGSGGSTGLVFCQALNTGSWAVPANTVVNLVTSTPTGVSLTVTNPSAGTPGGPAQTEAQFRTQVLTAGVVGSTGTPDMLKTQLYRVPGVQQNLVSVRQQMGGGWEVIVGGTADPYAIAAAIYFGLFDVSTLVGSTNPARNVTVAIDSYPDTYSIVFVVPPVQVVTMVVTWNTSSVSFVSPAAVAGLAQPALADYVNSIPVGSPINELEMTAVFQDAIVSIVPTVLLTRLVFTVSINGVVTPPQTGTGIVVGDPESYFSVAESSITVIQG